MAKRSSTKITEYVDARRDMDAMLRQLAKDPTLATKPLWSKQFREAKAACAITFQNLTGGELGKAQLLLAMPALPPG